MPKLSPPAQSSNPAVKKYLSEALTSNSSASYLRLANLYFKGDSSSGLMPDIDSAAYYYYEAAERGNNHAKYNFALLFKDTYPDLVFKYLTE